MSPALSALAALAILAGLWFAIVRKTRARRGRASAESTLLRHCQGDRDQADRLLASELERNPGMSRAEAAERAVERRRRDNR